MILDIPFQNEAVQAIFDYYHAGNKGNPCISAATGAGKSIIIAKFIHKLTNEYPNQRVIVAAHVQELVKQNYDKLVMLNPNLDMGIYSAALKKKQSRNQIVYGSIQSISRKPHLFGKRQFLIVDEVHLLTEKTSGMYQRLIKVLKEYNPYLKVMGLTATPWRTKGGLITEQENAIITDIVYEITIPHLIKLGRLVPVIGKRSCVQADMSGVRTVRGDFEQSEMEQRLDNEILMESALDEIDRLTKDTRHSFLFFCSGVTHAQHALEILHKRGWDARIVTGDTPKEERDGALEWFKQVTPDCKALVNNAVLTTGTDLPNIDCIILWRATKSSVLYTQMVGRGMRLHPSKKDCLLLDFAGNVERFGCVELIEPSVPKGKGGGDAPFRICPNDQCGLACHAAIKICPHCGTIFPVEEKPKHDATATLKAVSQSEEAEPFGMEVEDVRYKVSTSRRTGIPQLQVMYFSKYGFAASEFVFFDHEENSYPRKSAVIWHNERAMTRGMEAPASCNEALEYANKGFYRNPISITIVQNGAFQNVKNATFKEPREYKGVYEILTTEQYLDDQIIF